MPRPPASPVPIIPTLPGEAVPFTAAELARARPVTYHFTAPANAARATRTGRLDCAAALLTAAGLTAAIRERRRADVPLDLPGGPVLVSHQRPLKAGCIVFDAPGWDFARYVAHLNARVFFWPGRASGPVAQGKRHLAGMRAAGYAPAILRVPTADLIDHNTRRGPWLTRCNSGATRGRVQRGAGTFRRPQDCPFPATEAAELTFLRHAVLPPMGVWEGV